MNKDQTQEDKISIIIPFLNEAENIERLTTSLDEFCGKHKFVFEVLFVDDGSRDNSVELLKQFYPKNFFSKVIKLSQNYGSHAALRAGIQQATGNYITFVYADLQDPLELVLQMHEKCSKGSDITWAVRATTKLGFFEGGFSRLYASLMKKFVSPRFPSKGFDVVMFNHKIQDALNANIEANSSIFLQILLLGFRQDTITYNKQERKAGKSKWTLKKKIKLFIDSFVAFSFFPIRLVTSLGITIFLLGLLWTIYIICRELIYGDLTPGWPALISIITMGFGVTNISMGIIAEYLWRTLDASRSRPVFIIDEVIKLENKKTD